MIELSWSELFVVVVVATIVSAILTRVVRAFALQKQIVDVPGQRRIHKAIVPRGGGLSLALVILAGLIFIPHIPVAKALSENSLPMPFFYWGGLGFAVFCATGWCDDVFNLSVKTRLKFQLLASLLVVLSPLFVNLSLPTWSSLQTSLPLAFLVAFLIMVSVNVHNFMDGANGMLAWQALFVLGAMAVVLIPMKASQPELTLLCFISIGAVLGFLPFNFPSASIFMGDVGSYAIGTILALLSWWLYRQRIFDGFGLIILHSAFLLDSGWTLVTRILKGKAFWRGHREHLYQWLIRTGTTHHATVLTYMLWNVIIVAPCLTLAMYFDDSPTTRAIIALIVLCLGSLLWWLGKRSILQHRRA